MGGDEETILVHKIKAREKNDLTKMEPLQSIKKNFILKHLGQIKACLQQLILQAKG